MKVERYPNLNGEVGGLIPNCEIFFLMERLSKWSTASCGGSCSLEIFSFKFFKNKSGKKSEEKGGSSFLGCSGAWEVGSRTTAASSEAPSMNDESSTSLVKCDPDLPVPFHICTKTLGNRTEISS